MRPTKTFGLTDPMDVWIKINFDLDRLKTGRGSADLQYAALDCAIWSYHLIDWVLAHVDEATHHRLTGKARGGRGAISGFIKEQSAALPNLVFCQQIANTGKHRILTVSPDDPDWTTGSKALFDPPFDPERPAPFNLVPVVYLKDAKTGAEIRAVDFFESVVLQWKAFLQRHDLYHAGWDSAHDL